MGKKSSRWVPLRFWHWFAKAGSALATSRATTIVLISVGLGLIPGALGQQSRLDVLTGGSLSPGFDVGVNSSEGKTAWLKNKGEDLKMSYPRGQSWGAVFVTVGKPTEPPRPFRDLSAFSILAIEMKGRSGREQLEIGIKTNAQADDGSETKVAVILTSHWKTYYFRLDSFDGADPSRLYVVTEFVFSGPAGEKVFARNIRYSTSP
jgi:hypothetical protein